MIIGTTGVTVLMLLALQAELTTGPDAAEKTALDNGIRVLLAPVDSVDFVTVIAMYPIGSWHEPEGMFQSAHLLEHLACQSKTKSYEAGESFRLLGKKGTANAETLPILTYFDYTLPADELELAVKIEAERLTSLTMAPEVIAAEAKKCDGEVNVVAANPKAGMIKFAFNALAHYWRHGTTSARLTGELQKMRPQQLEQFRSQAYRPGDLVLAVVGNLEPDKVRKLVDEHLGRLAPGRSSPSPMDWSKVNKEATVLWDANYHAVCIAFPPPHGNYERTVLTLWGHALILTLGNDPQIGPNVQSLFVSNITWPVGPLPFFVYATSKDAATLERVQVRINSATRSFIDSGTEDQVNQIRMMANHLASPAIPSREILEQQASSLAGRMQSKEQAMKLVIGNSALQWALRETTGLTKDLSRIGGSKFDEAELKAILAKYLSPERQITTYLKPAEANRKARLGEDEN